MASPRIYVDYNATSPVRPAARIAALAAVDAVGNASSIHAEGRDARRRIEGARRQVAALVGAEPGQVVFTSGGTEAAHLALAPQSRGSEPLERLIVGATEHAAVLDGHRFQRGQVDVVPVDPHGLVRLDRLDALLRHAAPAVVALQAANNETGVIQDVRAVAALVHAAGGLLVCDAVQAAGRIDCTKQALGADIVLLSAHKLGGLQGAGAVAIIGEQIDPPPAWRGGGQERGRRGGTESVPAVAAFGAAAEIATDRADVVRVREIRDLFEAEVTRLAPDVAIFGAETARLPNTSCFALAGIAAEHLVMALDLGGVAVSSGSACSSGKVGRSHVLESMRIRADLRQGAVRVSFGWRSSPDDVARIIGILASSVTRVGPRTLSTAA